MRRNEMRAKVGGSQSPMSRPRREPKTPAFGVDPSFCRGQFLGVCKWRAIGLPDLPAATRDPSNRILTTGGQSP
ncbi:unnamed protein product, partial [Mesorhabditis spiculigera]